MLSTDSPATNHTVKFYSLFDSTRTSPLLANGTSEHLVTVFCISLTTAWPHDMWINEHRWNSGSLSDDINEDAEKCQLINEAPSVAGVSVHNEGDAICKKGVNCVIK